MKKRIGFCILALFMMGMSLGMFKMTTHAFTICDDGTYTLIMNNVYGDIDGQDDYKIIRFNFDEGEEQVKLSDLTQGITAFNGRDTFVGWSTSSDVYSPASEDTFFKKTDFNRSGEYEGISFDKGKNIYACFDSNKPLEGTGKYYLTIDPFGGTVNGKNKIRLESDAKVFKNIDLTQYVAQREGYQFVGWGYNGRVVTSIDSSYFLKEDVITVTALYKKNIYTGEDRVLKLNANGGTIEGEESKAYDYIAVSSATLMPIFHYVPERKGYTFKGWNTKKDGSGKCYQYVYFRMWSEDREYEDLERDTFIESESKYKNLTLYAVWEGVPDQGDSKNYFESTGEIKGSLTLERETDEDYSLDIRKLEIPEELAKQNVKFLVDINLVNKNSEIVEVNGLNMKIKVELPEDVTGYDKYEVVYLNWRTGKIKDRLPVTIEDGYMSFTTTHLSSYGLVAEKNEDGKQDPVTPVKPGEPVTPENPKDPKDPGNPKGSEISGKSEDVKKTEDSKKVSSDKEQIKAGNAIPKTGDETPLMMYIIFMAMALCGIGGVIIFKKKR